jgi:ribonuclease HII
MVAGVDEVGAGALAGPVVAAAAILPLEARFPGLRDSKALSPEQREQIYVRALRRGLTCAVGLAYVQEIDSLNIFHAARLAMCRAVARLSPAPDYLLMDGHLPPDFGVACRAVVKGDALCPAISLASVMAKVYRDRLMRRLALLYPHYALEENKGYGTPAHYRALERYGPSPIHRSSFAPIGRLRQMTLILEAEGGGEALWEAEDIGQEEGYGWEGQG